MPGLRYLISLIDFSQDPFYGTLCFFVDMGLDPLNLLSP